MSYGNSKDLTHKPIVAALRHAGVIVYDMPQPGDILCYFGGRWLPIEIKTPLRQSATFKNGKPKKNYYLTASQQKRETQAPIPIATSPREALALFGIELKA